MTNRQLSDSQFQRLINGTKKAIDWKMAVQFIVYVVVLVGAFYTLRERVALVELRVDHVEQRVERLEK